MTRRTRLVGLIALVGFLSCMAEASGLLPTPCCSQSSKTCPGSSCDSTAAKQSVKAETILAVAPAPVPQVFLPVGPATMVAPAELLASLPPSFRRPMRN